MYRHDPYARAAPLRSGRFGGSPKRARPLSLQARPNAVMNSEPEEIGGTAGAVGGEGFDGGEAGRPEGAVIKSHICLNPDNVGPFAIFAIFCL